MRAFLSLPHGTPPEVEAAYRRALGAHEALEVARAPSPVQAADRGAFLLAIDRMMEADVLVADVSRPDPTIGWDIAWFLARGRLAVLGCERGARGMLSPMIAGNPSPWQRLLVYDRPEAVEAALRATLTG